MSGTSKTKKFRQEFGLAVRRKRHKSGISQEALADRADIHRVYISLIELGKINVSIGIAFQVAKALRVPLSKLIKEAENNT